MIKEQPKSIQLIGLPGSGKSTYAKQLAIQENAIILSSDQLRIELYNNINDIEHNNIIFNEIHKRTKDYLEEGRNVIIDSTNISYKKRKQFIQELNKINCYKECYLMATPYEKCLEQNNLRERHVPEYRIKQMYKNIFIPQYYEGWDNIHIVKNANKENFNINDLFNNKENGLNYINQDNPYHTLTIGEHCLKTSFNCQELISNFELSVAGVFHDIGKLFTKEFKNTKGENTEIAHYYNHMNVSAYLSLFYLNYDINTELNITNYIQWHMQPFFIEKPEAQKAKKKFIKMIGEDFYNKLLILHKADITAK